MQKKKTEPLPIYGRVDCVDARHFRQFWPQTTLLGRFTRRKELKNKGKLIRNVNTGFAERTYICTTRIEKCSDQ